MSGTLTSQNTSQVRTPHKSGHLTNQDISFVDTKHIFYVIAVQNVPALSEMGLTFRTLEPGRSCNNFEGYCSQVGER